MRTLITAMAVILSGSVVAAPTVQIEPAGTWAVKSTVIMSSCEDIPVTRVTAEQWIVNPTNEGYEVQVIGNPNQKLKYEAYFDGASISGKYRAFNAFGDVNGFSEISATFKGPMKASGLRIAARVPPKECAAVSTLEMKRVN